MLRLITILLSANFVWSGGEYVDSDRSFRLDVPVGYRVRTGTEKGSESYIPICHADSTVCLEYPESRFAGTNFESASVEVRRLIATDEKACVDEGRSMNSRDYLNGSSPIQVIDGIKFRHAIDGGAAAGHAVELDKYWGLDKGKCFEIATALTHSSFASYAPGMIREFTKQDQKKVTAELNKIVASFKAFERQ